MTIDIPNQADAPVDLPQQSFITATDLAIIAQAAGVEGVISGCAVSAQGSPNMTVAVASGSVRIANAAVVVTSGNLTVPAAHTTYPRTDLVTVNASGTKVYTSGTAAPTPLPPALPASSVALAMVYVPAGDTAVQSSQIRDRRITVPTPVGASQWTTLSKGSDETRSSTTVLAADSTLKFTMVPSKKYRFRARIWISAKAASDFKWRHAGPASPSFVRIYRMHRNAVTGAIATEALDSTYSGSDLVIASTSDQETEITIEGIVYNGSNSGDFGFAWAQNISVAENTTVRAGSYLEYAES